MFCRHMILKRETLDRQGAKEGQQTNNTKTLAEKGHQKRIRGIEAKMRHINH